MCDFLLVFRMFHSNCLNLHIMLSPTTATAVTISVYLINLITVPPSHSVGGQTNDAFWHLSSFFVVC